MTKWPIAGGIFPVRLLASSDRDVIPSCQLITVSGMLPCILFELMSKNVRLRKSPIESGRVPVRPRFFREID
jgi:hypothetical protein